MDRKREAAKNWHAFFRKKEWNYFHRSGESLLDATASKSTAYA